MTPTVEKVSVLAQLPEKEASKVLNVIKDLGGVNAVAGDDSEYGHLCSQLIEFGRMECRFRPQFNCGEDCLADPCPLIEEFGA